MQSYIVSTTSAYYTCEVYVSNEGPKYSIYPIIVAIPLANHKHPKLYRLRLDIVSWQEAMLNTWTTANYCSLSTERKFPIVVVVDDDVLYPKAGQWPENP